MIDADALAKHFRFLEVEFGAKRVKVKMDRWDKRWLPRVLYVNATTAVSIAYEVREAYLNVRLYPLHGAKLPIDAMEGLRGFPLNHIVALKNEAALLGSAYNHPEFEDSDHGLQLYFERVVDNLRRHAQDFIRGDFSLIPQLLPTLSERPGAATMRVLAQGGAVGDELVPTHVIVDRMCELWRMPLDQRKEEFELKDQAEAAGVYATLTHEFGAFRAADAVIQGLLTDAELTWQDVRVGDRERTRIECGLRMLQKVPAIDPTTEQLRQLVCKLPAIYVAFRLQRLVQRHLDEAAFIDTLAWGAQNAPAVGSRTNCLSALFLYFRNLRASEPSALEKALQSFERELRRLRSQDEELLGEVKSARRRVQGIRRSHPELPVPTADQFRAYRIEEGEEGEEVRYAIERREDRELSIDVLHLELRERTLFLEYSVLDPAVLTENAPAIIARTLLEEYAADAYRNQAELAVCFDLDWQQTRSVSLVV